MHDQTYRHEARLGAVRLGRFDAAGESEVAHLEVAVGVEEKVGRLEVAVDHVRRMKSLERAEGLIDEVL